MELDKNIRLQLEAGAYRRDRYYSGSGYDAVSACVDYGRVCPSYSRASSGLECALGDDPLSLMNENRLYLSRLKIGLLSSQIGMRGYVHEKVARGILEDEVVCGNELLRLEGVRDYDGAARLRLDSLARLSRERRAEEADFFRDTARIQKDLIDAIIEYKGMLKRGEVLEKL